MVSFRKKFCDDPAIPVECLQGILDINHQPEVVRFYRAPAAQQIGEDWFVIEVRPTLREQDLPDRQNGTGHGDPR
ncbi:MAG: hypothetical protein WDO56_20840 [Gammaproteobacteria bacterium]